MSLKTHKKKAGGVTLNLREAGQGQLMVFLHGISANASVWDPILYSLQESYHVIAVDQRGHGLSDKPSKGYQGQDFASDILRLIEATSSGPAIIVGHSLGARNGVVAAAMQKELVAGVVAVEFTPFIEPIVLDTLKKRVIGGNRTFASKDEIVSYLSERYPLMPPDAIERRSTYGYVERNGVFHPLADPSGMAATAAGLREDFEPAVRVVDRPILLVRGKESKLVSQMAFERTQHLRPDFKSLIVPDTDHYVPEEAPATMAKAIREFAQTI
ncbi:alpha/beta hydrolase [Methylovirgula ligni]|uniref:2-(Acetamidomethylene)succinate hydrolase n=1 Tax=Methylovirgula ligni TaxID=569860 RepID=A0A3D9YUL4_9HYPH|nr:alpha/beta hydrolase [Methylovirgula ligni]QAY96033.1 alpha/beta hydrolase [Methylovirgula ligni]REF86296.1 2-(acetamidomethylene)succinate hydrolase [Methylovirgula ligni]